MQRDVEFNEYSSSKKYPSNFLESSTASTRLLAAAVLMSMMVMVVV